MLHFFPARENSENTQSDIICAPQIYQVHIAMKCDAGQPDRCTVFPIKHLDRQNCSSDTMGLMPNDKRLAKYYQRAKTESWCRPIREDVQTGASKVFSKSVVSFRQICDPAAMCRPISQRKFYQYSRASVRPSSSQNDFISINYSCPIMYDSKKGTVGQNFRSGLWRLGKCWGI